MPNICHYCDKEITEGAFIGTVGGGVAHQRCYYLANPPRAKSTFAEVLGNSDDQVVVRELLQLHVPAAVKDVIVERFNEAMVYRHAMLLNS